MTDEISSIQIVETIKNYVVILNFSKIVFMFYIVFISISLRNPLYLFYSIKAGNVNEGNVQYISPQQQQQQQQQQQLQHYQDLTNQMNTMSIDNQNNNTRTDTASQSQGQQQLISPTSPSTPTEHTTPAQQQRKIVYVQGDQMQQGATSATTQYTNFPAGYPVQYYQNIVPNYAGYQETTGVAASAAVPGNTAHHVISPQPAAMIYQRGGNSFYVPMAGATGAQAQQQMMLVSGGAGQLINGQKWTDFYTRNTKFSNIDSANEYRKVETQYQQGYALQQPAPQPNISMAQQRPLMQIQSNYQQYAYMQGPPKR